MAQLQLMVLKLRPSFPTNLYHHHPQLHPNFHVLPAISLSSNLYKKNPTIFNYISTNSTSGFRLFCKFNDSDSMSQLELGKQYGRQKPEKRVNAVFWIILLNLAIFVADHIFLVRDIKALYLFHNRPAWYQFVTAAFCHANWNHLSSNLFFLYIFGKLVEEEEGSFALWLSYILTGAGANLVSWLVLPRNAVSVGASGAVFGLFAISVLVKMSMDWRKILEVLILGQFVIEKVMEAAQASTGLSNGFIGTYALQNVNHIAHLSGAMVGVLLVWLVSRVPSDPSEKEGFSDRNKR
ncbi:rhomboid-like protein 11, chloroplastic isoform X1 [Amaranthus tricolor]|uniref:rhomboid-like protein 11, chloroplastic isoform X1 n=1 Tax=Amaranthus tricolor TaxID=29722 RepID=UPI00258DFF00|nr:rhomboid-like protein 11, chloroplastic isoform X1 [Amaranthus tricolor]